MRSPAVLPASAVVELGVAAPPEDLWRFVSDPTVPARFSPELQEAYVEGGGPAELGAVIVGRNGRGDVSWTTHSTVVACDPPHRFSWATGGADEPAATWSIEVRSAAGGSTVVHRVVLHEGREPLRSAIAREPARAAKIVEDRIAEILGGMVATLEGIAALSNEG